jgi:hypothetical protein
MMVISQGGLGRESNIISSCPSTIDDRLVSYLPRVKDGAKSIVRSTRDTTFIVPFDLVGEDRSMTTRLQEDPAF